jgi:hypothetical protein
MVGALVAAGVVLVHAAGFAAPRSVSFTVPGTTRTLLRTPDGYTSRTASVTIANLSDKVAVPLRFNSSAAPDFSSIDRIVAHVRATAASDTTHALAMSAWRTVRDYRYHWDPASQYDDLHDPVKLLGVYGCGLCDDSCTVLANIWKRLGLQVRLWNFPWHIVTEYGSQGSWHMLDADLGYYAPSPETGDPLPLAALVKTPDLLTPVPHPDTAVPLLKLGDIKGLLRKFPTAKMSIPRDIKGHRIIYQLAPQERVTRHAVSSLGYYCDRDFPPPPLIANAVFEWEPTTTTEFFRSLLRGVRPQVIVPPQEAATAAVAARTPRPGRFLSTTTTAVLQARRTLEANSTWPSRTTATAVVRSRPGVQIPTLLPFVLTGGEVEIEYRETTPRPEPLEVRFSGEGTSWALGMLRSFARSDDGHCKLRADVPPGVRGVFRVFLGINRPGGAMGEVEILRLRRRYVTQCSPFTFPGLLPAGQVSAVTIEADAAAPLEVTYRW